MTWRRLSPKMLAVHPVQEAIRFLPVLVGVLFIGSDGQGHSWSLGGLGLAVGAGLLRWFTTTYRITPTHVHLRRGLLRRQEMSVPRDRVRSVDLTARPLQRVLGLNRVVIGTGRSDRTDEGLTLDALDRADAARLREELLRHSIMDIMDTVHVGGAGTTIVRLAPAWIRFGPFTSSGIATIGVVVGSLMNLVNESRLPPDQFGLLRTVVARLTATPMPAAVAEVTVFAVIVVAVLSAIAYVLAFWNFRLTRTDATLQVTRGLLTTRSTTIELRRLRGVEVNEPLLLRAAGGARCLAITTGLRAGRGAERGGSILLPPAPLAEARRVAGEVIGDPAPATVDAHRHGPRARRRRHVRTFAFVTGALLLSWWLAGWHAWEWQVSLGLFPICALLAEDRYRNLGHAFAGGRLVFQYGSVVRRKHVLSPEGVIGWTVRRSFFQRRSGLVTLTATTAAGRQHYSTVDIPATDAIAFADAVTPGMLRPFLRVEATAPPALSPPT